MCLNIILKLFHKSKLVLPHPQESQDLTQTMETPGLVEKALNNWFTEWNVPTDNQTYFASKIVINLVQPLIINGNEYPACSYDDGTVRHLDIEPSWCNAGVIAHEQAHNSYALLTDEQKTAFTVLFDSLKNTDPKLVYLWSVNSYGTTSDVEGHAECYRYWDKEMPESLKGYYPKLF